MKITKNEDGTLNINLTQLEYNTIYAGVSGLTAGNLRWFSSEFGIPVLDTGDWIRLYLYLDQNREISIK